jgi:uncharacterized membrane protein YdfJ with MMPL/SSD domain
VKAVRAAAGGGFTTAVTGDHSVGADFGTISQTDLQHGEFEIGLRMGLALGIDYSLFVVSRYREERGHGLAQDAAIRGAGATASRAVLFSGSTFVVALFGMLIVPTSIMRSLAAGGIVSVAAALTLLPALLALIGDRVNALPVPFLGRNLDRADAAESRLWRRVVGGVLRRPALSLVFAGGAMLAAAVPTLGIHIGQNSVLTLPASLPSRQGYVELQREFGAANPYPVIVAASGGGRETVRRLERVAREFRGNAHFGPAAVQTGRDGVAALTAPVVGDAVGEPAVGAVRALTKRVDAAFAGSSTRPYVGGKTAEAAEYYDAATSPTPYVLAFVLGLSFVLLTVAFRSLVVALVSIVLPSMMSLLGRRSWYLPSWLEWLPHVEVERHPPEPEPAAV